MRHARLLQFLVVGFDGRVHVVGVVDGAKLLVSHCGCLLPVALLQGGVCNLVGLLLLHVFVVLVDVVKRGVTAACKWCTWAAY